LRRENLKDFESCHRIGFLCKVFYNIVVLGITSVRVEHRLSNNALGRREKDYVKTWSFEMKRIDRRFIG
jgi:hypothetical protein